MADMEKREVVISGIGGMFPGSGDLEQLGKNILANEYLVQRQEALWNQSECMTVELLVFARRGP